MSPLAAILVNRASRKKTEYCHCGAHAILLMRNSSKPIQTATIIKPPNSRAASASADSIRTVPNTSAAETSPTKAGSKVSAHRAATSDKAIGQYAGSFPIP